MKQKLYGVDFKHLEVNGYRNINEIYLQKNQLHNVKLCSKIGMLN